MLNNGAWLDQQLATELSRSTGLEKLIRLERFKSNEAKAKLTKVQEGWDNGIYTEEKVRKKVAAYREIVNKADLEIERLREQMGNRGLSPVEAGLIWREMEERRNRNLQESTFEERVDLVARLGIKILPSENLKSRKIFCRLNLVKTNNSEREQAGFAKVTLGGPKVTFAKPIDTFFELSINAAPSPLGEKHLGNG
jgi:hypothetical protein